MLKKAVNFSVQKLSKDIFGSEYVNKGKDQTSESESESEFKDEIFGDSDTKLTAAIGTGLKPNIIEKRFRFVQKPPTNLSEIPGSVLVNFRSI